MGQNKSIEEHWYSDEKSFIAILVHCVRADISWMDFKKVIGEYEKDGCDHFLVPIKDKLMPIKHLRLDHSNVFDYMPVEEEKIEILTLDCLASDIWIS